MVRLLNLDNLSGWCCLSDCAAAVTPAVSMLAVFVAAAATVLTASHRDLLADCALPHSQMHGLLTFSASATCIRAAFDTVS